jgi:hypothetical protein
MCSKFKHGSNDRIFTPMRMATSSYVMVASMFVIVVGYG